MDRKQMKEIAKRRLSENRWTMIITTFVFMLISAFAAVNSGASFSASGSANLGNVADASNSMTYTQTNPVMNAIAAILMIFVVDVMIVGLCDFFRKNITMNMEFASMFSPFKAKYLRNVGAMLLSQIFITIGCILLIVPGIIVALGLTLVPYLLAEFPELGAMEAIKMSWNLMKGHKGEYFVLGLSFFGWLILDMLTLGILGIFYVHPYIYQTQAVFCNEVMKEMQ